MVARKFNQKHKEVVKRIEYVKNNLEDLGVVSNPPKIMTEEREYRGQKYTAYLMNREFFSLLAMRFKGKIAFRWQVQFVSAFHEMENHILSELNNKSDKQWLNQRSQGKLSRREETDVIKDFVEYATNQGSKSAKYYYKHITNATYKALGIIAQRKPKIRDTMNIYDLAELLLMERVARNSLEKYMKLERNYKDIYESTKEDLLRFGVSLLDVRPNQLETRK